MILADLIAQSGVRYQQKGNEFTLCCPFCVERGFAMEGRHPNLGINTVKGVAHCYRCDWKSANVVNIARHLARVYGLDFDLHTLLREHGTNYRSLRKNPSRRLETSGIHTLQETGYPDGYEAFLNPTDPIEKRARSYLRDREISVLQRTRHKIGFAAVGPMAWRILFPVLGKDGKVYGSVGRDFSGQATIKYLNTPGMKMLWGCHQEGSTAVVCEGVIDALHVENALLASKGTVAIARLGSAITEVQLSQLKRFDRVVIFPDRDEPGVKGAIQLCERCEERKIQPFVVVPDCMDDRDPGSMQEKEILDAVSGARPWSQELRWRLRLSATKHRDAGD